MSSWEDVQRQIIAENPHLLKLFQNLKYANIALLTILVYDHLLTLDLEIKRIWTLPWRLPKVLFILNRYVFPPFLFFEGFSNTKFGAGAQICQAKRYTNFPTFVFIMTVELMLILRVLALYGNCEKMVRLLRGLYALQFFVWLTITIVIICHTRGIPGGQLFSGCLYNAPKYNFLGWVPGLLFECLLIGLTIHKCFKFRLGEFPPSVQVLARDSVIYFVSITAILAFNTFYTIFGERLLAPSLVLPSGVATSIAAARLTMNIRRFTMDQGMAALGNIGSQARLSCRTIGEDRQCTGPSAVFTRPTISLQARGRSDDGFDDREEFKERGRLVGFHQALPKYLAVG